MSFLPDRKVITLINTIWVKKIRPASGQVPVLNHQGKMNVWFNILKLTTYIQNTSCLIMYLTNSSFHLMNEYSKVTKGNVLHGAEIDVPILSGLLLY